MAPTSYNTIFTLRIASDPWSARSIFEGADSADNPALPNRVAAGPTDLKAVRVREYKNVIRNYSKTINKSKEIVFDDSKNR
jgi:hypothetical protein